MNKVIVIGGGIAGLTAAFTLKQMGIAVRILEKDELPGGRVRSVREKGFIIDRGASFLSSAYRETFALINELSLQNTLREIQTDLRCDILRGNQFHRVNYSSRLGPFLNSAVPLSQRLRLPLMLWLVLKARCLGVDFSTLGGLDSFDDESIESYATRKLGHDLLEYFLEPFLKLMWGWNSRDTSKAMLVLLGTMGRQKVWSLKNGLGSLTETLASQLDVSYDIEVVELKSSEKTVLIKYRNGSQENTMKADAVVLAVPGPVALSLWKELPQPEKQFLEQIHYLPSIAVHFTIAKNIGENIYGYLFPEKTGKKTAGIGLEHRRLPQHVPSGYSLLYTGLSVNEYEKFIDSSDDMIAEYCLSDLRDVFGNDLIAPMKHHVFRWEHALPVLRVGAIRALSAYRNKHQAQNIILAGDYMASPCIEGAVTSGREAAKSAFAFLTHAH